ncbi:hypothetical protein [uncultured Lactobacillus sp.]|nr:hypothetical protein [uncultured Lactobacillus sp.]
MEKKSIADKETAMLIAKKYLIVCKYCRHVVHNGNYCENCGHRLN